jgi:hypothetical protein
VEFSYTNTLAYLLDVACAGVEILQLLGDERNFLTQAPGSEHQNGRRRPMERSMIEAHLEQAERHVARGEELIAEQKARIAEMERDGHDTGPFRDLLRQFEETQRMHVADRDRLRKELNERSDGL